MNLSRFYVKAGISLLMLLAGVKEVLAQWGDRGYCPWGIGSNMMGWGWAGGLFMVILWILIIVLIILLIRRLVSSGNSPSSSSQQGDSALEILKKRYARGEINKEEFEAKKKDLS